VYSIQKQPLHDAGEVLSRLQIDNSLVDPDEVRRSCLPSDFLRSEVAQPDPTPACTAQSLQPDDRAISPGLPATPFEGRGLTFLDVACVAPGWNPCLATAFRSSETTARFQTAIPGSFPACCFDALPNLRQARSVYGSFALSG